MKWIIGRRLSGNSHIACLTKAINTISYICLEALQLSQSFPDDAEINGRLLTDLLPSIASRCPNLNDLDLSENNLGVPGACAIGEAFVKLTTQREKLELNLIETNINSEAATVLSEKVLVSLDDVLNPLSCELVLCVDENPLGHSGLLAIFRIFRHRKCPITRLSLDKTNVAQIMAPTPDKTENYGENIKLKKLFFVNNRHSNDDTVIALLEKTLTDNTFSSLKTLKLKNTLPDNAAMNGRLLTNLLPTIASHCPNLKKLDLSQNNLGVPGACAVGEAFVGLAANRKKLKLNLSEIKLDSEAATVFSDNVLFSLEDVSNPLSCKFVLYFDNNPLGNKGMSAIFRMLCIRKFPVRSISLERTDSVNQNQLKNFGEYEVLFSSHKRTGNTHVAFLTEAVKVNCFTLEKLNLSKALSDNVEVNGKLLTELLPSIASHCPNLSDLDLSKNNLGVPGARALEMAIGSLVTSKKKFHLTLDETNVDMKITEAFSDQVFAILEIPLSCVFECIQIEYPPLGPISTTDFSMSRTLPSCKFPGKSFNLSTDAIILVTTFNAEDCNKSIFGERKALQWLLSEICSGDSCIFALSEAIKTKTFYSLETLTLSQSFPDDAEMNGRLLTDLLPSIASRCPNLIDLDLSENNLGVPGACALGQAFSSLATNRKELKLNLSETNIDSEAATAFSNQVLASSSDISNPLSCEINLLVDNNPLGHSGLLAIFRVFSNNNYDVKTLYLKQTIRISTFSSVATFCWNQYHHIAFNSTVTILSLDNNYFCGKNIVILTECLKSCLSLKRLDCCRCHITSKDLITLFSHLKSEGVQRRCLKWWELRKNSIDDTAIETLTTMLPLVFPCINCVGLDHNLLSADTVETLKEFLLVRCL